MSVCDFARFGEENCAEAKVVSQNCVFEMTRFRGKLVAQEKYETSINQDVKNLS